MFSTIRQPVLLSKTVIFSILSLFTCMAFSQADPENMGWGVLDPELTGIRPPARPEDVSARNGNDPSYVNTEIFQQQMIDLHNQYRQEHGVYPVAWDPMLVETAQQLADTCVYGHSDAIVYDQTTKYGENIWFGYETVELGVRRWGEERVEYAEMGYQHDTYPTRLLHFSQMVWKQTNTIGCARKKCIADQTGEGRVEETWFVACHYYNRGNFLGEYVRNVFPQGTPVGSR